MSNKPDSGSAVIAAVVIGVVVTATICYIIYLQNEQKRLKADNDFLKKKMQDDEGAKIINIDVLPHQVQANFEKVVISGYHKKAKKTKPKENKITFAEAYERVMHLKNVIENRGGHTIFYRKDKPILKEKDLHVLYDLSWGKTMLDVNKEVNNGRGPVDFKISMGLDQTLVEFKLAKDTRLKQKLLKQVQIYAKSNNKPDKIICIIYTTFAQETKVKKILKEVGLESDTSIIVIDARKDNKKSASNVA